MTWAFLNTFSGMPQVRPHPRIAEALILCTSYNELRGTPCVARKGFILENLSLSENAIFEIG